MTHNNPSASPDWAGLDSWSRAVLERAERREQGDPESDPYWWWGAAVKLAEKVRVVVESEGR
jgi:hypothetical protein